MKNTFPWMILLTLTALISFSQLGIAEPMRTIDASACPAGADCRMRDVESVMVVSNHFGTNAAAGFEHGTLDHTFANTNEDLFSRQTSLAHGFTSNIDSNSVSLAQSLEVNDGTDTKCTINCPPSQVPEPGSVFLIASGLGGIGVVRLKRAKKS